MRCGNSNRLLLVAGQALQDIKALLLEGIGNPSEGVRLCSTQWATRLFPFADVEARYICVLAAADKKLEVRETGLNGLKQDTFSRAHTVGEGFIYALPHKSGFWSLSGSRPVAWGVVKSGESKLSYLVQSLTTTCRGQDVSPTAHNWRRSIGQDI